MKTKILKIDHIFQVRIPFIKIFEKTIRLKIIQLTNTNAFQVQRYAHSATETPSSSQEMHSFHDDDFVELTVSRQNLVESAIDGLSRFSEFDCKRRLKVRILIFL